MHMGTPRVGKLTLPGLLVLLGTLALLVAGCGSSSSGNIRPDAQQVLRIPINANSPDIKTMDPAVNQDFYSYVPIAMTFPGLVTLDVNGQVQPWAAEALPAFDTTNNTYTFKIRPGLKWSDGTPIDANTYAYSINRSLNPCIGSLVTYYLFPILNAAAFSTESCNQDGVTVKGKIQTLIGTSLMVPDSQTLVIKLNAPAPYFLQALAYPTSFAQPKQLIDQYGNKDWTNHLTGNGGFGGNLFKVKLWDHKGHLDLIRNDGFWGTKPNLREVDLYIFQTLNSEFADYLDGGLDQGVPPPAQYKQAKTRSDFHEQPFLNISYYQPNWNKPPFDDARVRQAFSLAIDRDVLANQVNQGIYIPTFHIVPKGMYGYDSSLTLPDGTQSLTGDVPKATALMQDYAKDKCGGQFSKCPPVTLFDGNDPAAITSDQAVVAMWQAAFPAYPIKTQFEDFNTLLQQIYSPNAPQIFAIGWAADYPDPQDWLSLQFAPGSINNTGNVSDPAANTLMAKADTDLNPTTRLQEYNQAEQLLVDQGAWISFWQQKTVENLQPYVHNFQFNSLGYIPLGSWQQIYLTK